MKTAVMKQKNKTKAPAYPNAADSSYFLHKFLDAALGFACVVGIFVAISYLLLL